MPDFGRLSKKDFARSRFDFRQADVRDTELARKFGIFGVPANRDPYSKTTRRICFTPEKTTEATQKDAAKGAIFVGRKSFSDTLDISKKVVRCLRNSSVFLRCPKISTDVEKITCELALVL